MLYIVKDSLKLNGKVIYINEDHSVLQEVFLRLEAYVDRYGKDTWQEALEDILEELIECTYV